MPVYASTPSFAEHRRHPKALLFIVGGHAVLIAAVMTAKMEIVQPFVPTTTLINFIDSVKPPPPPPPPKPQPEVKQQVQPRNSSVDQPQKVVQIPSQPTDTQFVDLKLPPLPPIDRIGDGVISVPPVVPKIDPVRVAAVFNTPDYLLRPPYPADKQRLEEEGTLRLRLSIDERGRVVAVEPVGNVDRSFFESARKHLLSKWRFKPATEGGRAVPSSTVITLRFELERA